MAYREKRRRLNPRFLALCLAAVLVIAAAGVWIWGKIRPGVSAAAVVLPDYVKQEFLTVNPWSRPGTELEQVKGIVIHYVGNPGTSAEANRSYFEGLEDGHLEIYASAHFIVGLEGEVLQCIPLTEWAYASNTRNEDTLSIEVCHPDETGEFLPVTYDRVAELTAFLCDAFGLTSKDVLRHYDISGKNCPKYYVENEDAWQTFLTQVDRGIGLLEKERAEKEAQG